MSAPAVEDSRTAMENQIDFIVVNFADSDMVGHTGVLMLTIRYFEAVDKRLDLIIKLAKNTKL